MDKETKEKLEELLKSNEQNEQFLFGNTDGMWIMMLLTLLFAPQRQDPPIININIGDDKNVQ